MLMAEVECWRRERTPFGSRIRLEKRLDEVEGVGDDGCAKVGEGERTCIDVIELAEADGAGAVTANKDEGAVCR